MINVKIIPTLIGKNQTPRPVILPFAIQIVETVIRLKIKTIASFKYLMRLVANLYCLKAFSGVILLG
jgi:hypothetical protein